MPPTLEQLDRSPAVRPAHTMTSEAGQLVQAALTGDVVATQRLLTSVTPRMTRVVHAVLGTTHADVDDVVQQALIGFLQALPAFRGECEPVHFASRIAVRAAVAAARRTWRARGRREDDVDLDSLASSTDYAADRSADSTRLKECLRDLLSRIPGEQAEAIALRFVLGWSLEEVSRVTGAPVNTVRSRVRLAKKALRAAIEVDPILAEELGVVRHDPTNRIVT
jgi:RNA polymerase sigma factor (sigma-70 family)